MKAGDTVPVILAGFTVANATVESIEDGKATLLVPATRVVMGVRMSLTDLDPEVDRVLSDNVQRDEKPEITAEAKPTVETTVQETEGERSLREMKLDSDAID